MLHVFEALMGHFVEEFLVARHSQIALGGMAKTGAFSAGGIAVKRKVGHYQSRVAQLHCATVQLAILVLKNAQMRAFLGQFGHDGDVVGIAHAQQDDKPGADGPGLSAVDGHAGTGHALNDCSHK